MLWQQAAGGAVTEAMQKAIDNEREDGATSRLLEQAEETFRDYVTQEDPTSAADHVPLKPSDDLTMSFNGFYNAYLQPYFGDRRPAPRRPGARRRPHSAEAVRQAVSRATAHASCWTRSISTPTVASSGQSGGSGAWAPAHILLSPSCSVRPCSSRD